MRERFKKNIETYGEIAKEKIKEEKTPDEKQQLEQVLDWNLRFAEEKRETSYAAQTKIFNIQEEK